MEFVSSTILYSKLQLYSNIDCSQWRCHLDNWGGILLSALLISLKSIVLQSVNTNTCTVYEYDAPIIELAPSLIVQIYP